MKHSTGTLVAPTTPFSTGIQFDVPNSHLMRRRGKGFSIIEILVCLALLAVLSTLGILAFRQTTQRSGVRGLANTLGAALADAHTRALTTGVPVSLGFPSQGGSSPIAASFYRLEGTSNPTVTSSENVAGDYPGLYFFNGIWPTDTSTFRNPGAVPQPNPAPSGTAWTVFADPSSWLPAAFAQDYVYVFLPDGSVVSNGMVAFDGAYHILVTAGAGQWNSANSGSRSLWSPTQLSETWTVTLTLDGQVQVNQAVQSLKAGSITFQPALAPAATVPAPQTVTIAAEPTPVVTSLTALSNQTLGSPSSTNISLGLGDYLSLDVSASDSGQTGQRLYALWTAQASSSNRGTGSSAFSRPQPGAVAMDWDPTVNSGLGGWRCSWDWRPPADGAPGDSYNLNLVVQDSQGLSRTATLSKTVTLSPPGQILAATYSTSVQLGLIHSDGSDFRIQPIAANLPLPASWNPNISAWEDCYFSPSADGDRIGFSTCKRLAGPVGYLPAVTERTFSTASVWGTATTAQLLTSLSPAGDMMAYIEWSYSAPDSAGPLGGGHLYVQATGSPNRILVDKDCGYYWWPGLLLRDAFHGMNYRELTDHIAWDPTGGFNGAAWTLYYSAFGTATAPPDPATVVATPQIRTCSVKMSAAGPVLVSAPAPVSALDGCYCPNIPFYDSAPYLMTLVRWNGDVSGPKTVTVWDPSQPLNPPVDQNLVGPGAGGVFQDPCFVPSAAAGTDYIICGNSTGMVYSGYGSSRGAQQMVRFTYQSGNSSPDDLTPIGPLGYPFCHFAFTPQQ